MTFRSSLAILLVFVPLLAFGQLGNPVIRSVQPSTGGTSGGTTVTITGDNLGSGVACILPCPPRAAFGGVTVDAEYQRDGLSLIVKTPAHAAGTVDVSVFTPDGRTATARNAFTYTTSQEASYERILLPIHLNAPVPGANGSRWRTDFWLRNNGGARLTLAPWPCPDGGVCPGIFPLTQVLSPGETIHNLPPFASIGSTNPSRVLFASRDAVADMTANLRIYDESRSQIDAGAEIPVVRERDLLTGTTQLHAVPLNGAYRLNLRIYDLALTEARFRVRVYEEFAGTTTALPIQELELTATTPQRGEFRFEAAYADYGTLTFLLNSPVIRPPLLRVQIEPLTEGSRYWAFISVTNNDTQRVTLITPN